MKTLEEPKCEQFFSEEGKHILIETLKGKTSDIFSFLCLLHVYIYGLVQILSPKNSPLRYQNRGKNTILS